ncbi:LCP family protein [Amycolatopsis sp. NPDC026612]|uniref:LCP family protein n=1 Tax=Amycolatopsis sp. NPDC026612 TaxID=3155466 RepID=UPI0033ECCC3E
MTEQAAPTIPARRRQDIGHGAAVFARRGSKVVVSLLSVVVLALTWYGWQYIGDPNHGLTTTNVFADTEAHAKPLDGAIDILLVGQDSRTDAQGNPLPREVLDMLHAGVSDGELNTDTMILVHIPQNGKHAIAISFPRDSWVELTGGFGKHKLNSAFVYAYTDTYRALQRQGMTDLKQADAQAKVAGRKNLIATLEKFIGKPGMIDRYAEVNLASFYEITKSIGGIEVCLKAPVKEKRSGVDLPAGRQTIEGVQALAFVRQRYDLEGADLGRIARQQAFLSGLARKVISSDVLTNPVKIADLVSAVKKSVVLSQGWDLTEFAEQMRGLTGGNIEFHTIPTLGNANIGGADVLRVDPAQVAAEVARLTSDGDTPAAPTSAAQLPGAKAVTVELFDGSGSPGLAGQTHTTLQGKGFTLAADQRLSTRNTTAVRYNPADGTALELVKQALGTTAQAEPDRDVPAGHVRVLLGKDFRNSAAGAGGAPTSTAAKPPAATSPAAPPAAPAITAGDVPCVN